MLTQFPPCSKCKESVLLPLSDYGGDRGGAAAVLWKAWTCASEACGFTIRIDNGRVAYDKSSQKAPMSAVRR